MKKRQTICGREDRVCMTSIEVDAVVDAMEELFRSVGPPGRSVKVPEEALNPRE
jgi:hypothetical protein